MGGLLLNDTGNPLLLSLACATGFDGKAGLFTVFRPETPFGHFVNGQIPYAGHPSESRTLIRPAKRHKGILASPRTTRVTPPPEKKRGTPKSPQTRPSQNRSHFKASPTKPDRPAQKKPHGPVLPLQAFLFFTPAVPSLSLSSFLFRVTSQIKALEILTGRLFLGGAHDFHFESDFLILNEKGVQWMGGLDLL